MFGAIFSSTTFSPDYHAVRSFGLRAEARARDFVSCHTGSDRDSPFQFNAELGHILFLQEDAYRGDRADPLSLNLYTYVSINPLIYWDPTGHVKAATTITYNGKTYNYSGDQNLPAEL